MRQISELTARIAKIETISTFTPAKPTPTPAIDATPLPVISAPPRELKGLKDPDAFDARAIKAISKTKLSVEPYDVEDDATTISLDEEMEKE
ncbi:hypothetical protein PTT_12673 [Pyrenophora teres f. teres 0-1]|uniref:Uncharacterized protein n=1 Tax=Pyrenophora teres f. teres (strain 0-1) TaxID=861557 RepID=E3RUC2_PYRTT|nr:hypothetical protein PTT_12673 [Pyrenophora teres f. teres 0-1]